MEYKPQSAGINLQSPKSDSTPWTLTLIILLQISLITPSNYQDRDYVGQNECEVDDDNECCDYWETSFGK